MIRVLPAMPSARSICSMARLFLKMSATSLKQKRRLSDAVPERNARPAFRLAATAQESGIHRTGSGNAGPGHRGQPHHLQLDQLDPAQPDPGNCAYRQHDYDHARRAERTSYAPVLLPRSEEHTSELQSLRHLVCRLLLEKKKNKT